MVTPMSDEEFTQKMVDITLGEFSAQMQHMDADELISEFLKSRGLDEAVKAYESIVRLYG